MDYFDDRGDRNGAGQYAQWTVRLKLGDLTRHSEAIFEPGDPATESLNPQSLLILTPPRSRNSVAISSNCRLMDQVRNQRDRPVNMNACTKEAIPPQKADRSKNMRT